jgi:osmotically inducible lipoprotein OsmB
LRRRCVDLFQGKNGLGTWFAIFRVLLPTLEISTMNTIRQPLGRLSLTVAILAALTSLSACENMSARDKSTAVGAGIGAAAGAVLTGGSAGGTVGGAAVGGVIGNQIKK